MQCKTNKELWDFQGTFLDRRTLKLYGPGGWMVNLYNRSAVFGWIYRSLWSQLGKEPSLELANTIYNHVNSFDHVGAVLDFEGWHAEYTDYPFPRILDADDPGEESTYVLVKRVDDIPILYRGKSCSNISLLTWNKPYQSMQLAPSGNEFLLIAEGLARQEEQVCYFWGREADESTMNSSETAWAHAQYVMDDKNMIAVGTIAVNTKQIRKERNQSHDLNPAMAQFIFNNISPEEYVLSYTKPCLPRKVDTNYYIYSDDRNGIVTLPGMDSGFLKGSWIE